jgi:hypothetical protein
MLGEEGLNISAAIPTFVGGQHTIKHVVSGPSSFTSPRLRGAGCPWRSESSPDRGMTHAEKMDDFQRLILASRDKVRFLVDVLET